MELDQELDGSEQQFNPSLKGTARLSWQSKPRSMPEGGRAEFQLAEVVIPRSGEAKISDFVAGFSSSKRLEQQPNRLIWGDNYIVMQALLSQGYREGVDLIYIDPPFNTGEIFNFNTQVTVEEEKYKKYLTMIERLAYMDYWERGIDSFLDMMYPRLDLMERLLSRKGMIYLHCDANASHYLKVVMDQIFGRENFVNEVIWKRSKWGYTGTLSRKFKDSHDTILVYAKSPDYYFEIPFKELAEASKEQYSKSDERGRYRLVPILNSETRKGETGKPWRGIDPNKLGRSGMHWTTKPSNLDEYDRQGLIVWPKTGLPNLKYYLDMTKGVPVTDIWTEIDPLPSSSEEFVGFPTQKPEELIKRILLASSKEGDLVADFFCGAGTTAVVAEELRRKWIAADYSKSAIHISRNRLLTKAAKPFVIENLGYYQRHLLYAQGLDLKSTYRVILNLYGATPRDDLIDVGVTEDGTLVYTSPPDRYLTAKLALDTAKKLEGLDGGAYSKLTILAWDYELQFDEQFERLRHSQGFETKLEIAFKTVPSDIYRKLRDSTLEELKLLSGRVRFYEKPYLKIGQPAVVSDLGDEALVRLKIDRYSPNDIPLDEEKRLELLAIIKNRFELLIEYYAVDWDYDGIVFRSRQQEFARFGRNRKAVNPVIEYKLRKGKKYRIVVRVVDIFGNDATGETSIDLG